MPPKKTSDDEIISAGLAIEVLNEVKYGGKSREPATAMMPFEGGPDLDESMSPAGVFKEFLKGQPAETADADPSLSDTTLEDAWKFVSVPWKTFLLGGPSEVFTSKKGGHYPGLAGVYDTGRRAVEATGLPEALNKGGVDMGLLDEGSLSRTVFTDPFLMGAVGKTAAKEFAGTVAGEMFGGWAAPKVAAAKNVARWGLDKSAKAVSGTKAGKEVGEMVNLAPELLEKYKGLRDASRARWTSMYDLMEDAIWNKARTKGFPFKGDIRDWVAKNAQTNRARYGNAFADAQMDVYSARAVARLNTLPVAKKIRANVPESEYLALSRYMRPRVVGETPVWPKGLSDDLKGTLDEVTASIDAKMAERVDLHMGSPEVHAEYRGNWYPRRFADRKFVSEKTQKLGPAKETHFARDAYGVRVKMSKEEAETLMKGTGGEGSALGRTDLVKGRAELDPIYSGQKGNVSLVKFSPKAYGSEEAARLARDEFAKRATNVKYKVMEKYDPFTEKQLAELGELKDPAVNIFEAQAQLEISNAKGRFYRVLSRDPEMALTPENAAKLGKNWKPIPESMRWGELSGMHVDPAVYRNITEFESTLVGPGMKVYKHVIRNMKAAKTIWAPATTTRNFFSNVPFSFMADATAPWAGGFHNYKYYREGWKALFADSGKLAEELVRKGISGTQFTDVELKVLEPLFRGSSAPGVSGWGNRVAEVLNRAPYMKNSVLTEGAAAEKVGAFYNLMDTMYRAGIYTKARRAWGMSPELASAHVNKFTPNYLEVGNAVRMSREHPLGGLFVSFPSESVRILRNGIRERPLKTALATGGAMGIYSAVHKGLTGMSDSQYQAIRQDGPMTVAWPTKDDDGNVQHFPLDYWSPWGWIQSGIMGNKYTRREEQEAGLTGMERNVYRFGDFVTPFALSNPAFTIPAGIVGGRDTFTKRKIQQEGQNWFGAYGKWLLRTALPELTPGVGRKAEMLGNLMSGRKGYKGEEYDTGDTLLNAFAGVNRRPYNAALEVERWSGQADWATKEMTTQFNRFDKMLHDEQIFPDEHEDLMRNVAKKYVGIIRSAKIRLYLGQLVQAERDLKEGRQPRVDIEKLEQALSDTREEKDFAGLQAKIDE